VHLTRMRLKNFQCFGPEPTVLDFEAMTYLLGPNGAGKTSALTALARMFAIDPQMRRVRPGDFHIAQEAKPSSESGNGILWVEADFDFPELASGASSASVPSFFSNMRMDRVGEVPRVRIRMTAAEDDTGDIDTKLVFVTETGDDNEPVNTTELDRYERAAIQVHYLPARRDPSEHIAHSSNTLLGRLLRAVDWSAEHAVVSELTQQLSDSLADNAAIKSLGEKLAATWTRMHTGTFFETPSVTFTGSDVDTLLRHLNIAFDTAPGGGPVDWTRLSDGQQSLLYLTMVLGLHALGTQVLAGNVATVDPAKLRPASFTLIALEEPENSLSPHYVGRVLGALREFSRHPDAQAIIATHSPSVVRRVSPESIRYLRLDTGRRSVATTIQLPPESGEAYKFVREAVEAFPELYFARLVILGEGDSEQIVLPRMLEAGGLSADLNCISVVPLGGRHVNHFWRLLSNLGIPHITLLDLDTARYQGGWGRVRYAIGQLLEHPTSRARESGLDQRHMDAIPAWDTPDPLINSSEVGQNLLNWLERCGVFFSAPLDLDFSMLSAYPDAYHLNDGNVAAPTDDILTAVLGKARKLEAEQYRPEQSALFVEYHRMFNNSSKPVQHLTALSNLSNEELLAGLPPVMSRLISVVKSRIAELPE
jgi:putative ATP-dependent endonuclease of OLD family